MADDRREGGGEREGREVPYGERPKARREMRKVSSFFFPVLHAPYGERPKALREMRKSAFLFQL